MADRVCVLCCKTFVRRYGTTQIRQASAFVPKAYDCVFCAARLLSGAMGLPRSGKPVLSYQKHTIVCFVLQDFCQALWDYPDQASQCFRTKSIRLCVLCCKTFVRRYGTTQIRQASAFVPKAYDGPSYEKIDQLKADHFPPALPNMYKRPVLIHQGHMQWLYDQDNKKYLDMFGGIVTVSVGHCHPKVVGALNDQINKLWHTTSIYRQPKIYEYIEKLVAKFPGDLKVVYLVNSGTEANDLAILLAKAYTGNNDVISLQSSYHGYSTGLMGLTASQSYRMPVPVPAGFYHTPLADPFRGYWGGCRDSLSQVPGTNYTSGDCPSSDKYIHQLKEVLETSIPAKRLAVMFAESIQGVNGTVQFPKGYIRKARELVKEHGGLFVSDEVQSGFGRTGDHFWGFEGHGIVPDIVTMAKGIGNGFPMAAVVTTKEIAAVHAKAAFFNTFGGNPMASAVGQAVLEVIEEEQLQNNCKVTGKYFIEQLMQLQKVHPVIGDVRGKGLMLGVEFVKPGTKEALPGADVADILDITKDSGVLFGRGGRWANVIRIKPPMCINKENVDFAVGVLDKAIKQHLSKK